MEIEVVGLVVVVEPAREPQLASEILAPVLKTELIELLRHHQSAEQAAEAESVLPLVELGICDEAAVQRCWAQHSL